MAVIKATAQRPTFAGTSLHDLGDLRKGAEEALDRARAEAARLVAEAKREVDKVYSESRESGFEQGKEEGFAAGFAEGRTAGAAAGREEARAAHEAMIKALEESFSAEFMRWVQIREDIMRSAERELAGTSIAIAEAIVREHVRCDTAAIATTTAATAHKRVMSPRSTPPSPIPRSIDCWRRIGIVTRPAAPMTASTNVRNKPCASAGAVVKPSRIVPTALRRRSSASAQTASSAGPSAAVMSASAC